jgi:hypothetical protein
MCVFHRAVLKWLRLLSGKLKQINQTVIRAIEIIVTWVSAKKPEILNLALTLKVQVTVVTSESLSLWSLTSPSCSFLSQNSLTSNSDKLYKVVCQSDSLPDDYQARKLLLRKVQASNYFASCSSPIQLLFINPSCNLWQTENLVWDPKLPQLSYSRKSLIVGPLCLTDWKSCFWFSKLNLLISASRY